MHVYSTVQQPAYHLSLNSDKNPRYHVLIVTVSDFFFYVD